MPNRIEVAVASKSLVIQPGETVEAKVNLHNLGQSIDQLNLSVEGLDSDWYTLPVSSVALFPNDKDELKIVLNPPKEAQTKAGSYPFRLKVSSQANPDEMTVLDMVVAIQALPEIEINITPTSIKGRRGVFKIEINNIWENETRLNFEIVDTSSALRYQIQPEALIIPAKSRAQATVEVSLGWLSFFGGDREFLFEVEATLPGAEEGKTVEGKLVRTAWYKMLTQIRLPRIRLPRWILVFFQRPPVINTFQAKTDDRITFTLAWSTKRSKEVKLNDDVVELLGEKAISPTSPTQYTLTVTNKYGTAQKIVDVEPRFVPKAKSSDRIRASLSSTEMKLQMGGIPEMTILQLQNMGEIVDKFIVDIEGIDSDWYSRSASSIALMPQTTEQAQISFQVPKKKGVRARIYPFAIVVHSQTNPSDITIINGNIEVLPFVDYKLKVAPYRVTCRRKGTFRVNLANTGTSETKIVLDATDLDEGLNFKFKNSEPVISAWQTVELPVIAKPKKGGLIGEKKRYDVTITSRDASGNQQTVNCELYHNPFVRSWRTIFRVIRSLIFLAIIVVIIVLIINWGGGWRLLTSSPKDWWSRLIDNIVNTFTGWFS